MIDTLREFQDVLAAAAPDAATISALKADLAAWRDRLQPMAVKERKRPWSHQRAHPGRGQTMLPLVTELAGDGQRRRGKVTFGDFYLGGNGAVHGGAIPLMFDEVMGWLSSVGRGAARTAYLHVNYRVITPVGKALTVEVWFDRDQGRKRWIRSELRDGDVLLADAEGLFVELRPGQP